MTDTTNIMTAIEEAITKGTFGLAAIESIKKMKDEHASLVAKNEVLVQKISTLESDIRNIKTMYTDSCATITKLQEAIAAFDKNKIDFLKQQLQAENAEARRNDIFELVSAIFRSPRFTETVHSSVPVVRDYGNNTGNYVEHVGTTTTNTKIQE